MLQILLTCIDKYSILFFMNNGQKHEYNCFIETTKKYNSYDPTSGSYHTM